MPFMTPEYYTGTMFYCCDHDGQYYPSEHFTEWQVAQQEDCEEDEVCSDTGIYARMNARGYADVSDWGGPFEHIDDAREWIMSDFDVDPEEGIELDEWEDNEGEPYVFEPRDAHRWHHLHPDRGPEWPAIYPGEKTTPAAPPPPPKKRRGFEFLGGVANVTVEDFDVICGDDSDNAFVKADEDSDGDWYVSVLVDSDTGSFVDEIATDIGPFPTRSKALHRGVWLAEEWCSNNDVEPNCEWRDGGRVWAAPAQPPTDQFQGDPRWDEAPDKPAPQKKRRGFEFLGALMGQRRRR